MHVGTDTPAHMHLHIHGHQAHTHAKHKLKKQKQKQSSLPTFTNHKDRATQFYSEVAYGPFASFSEKAQNSFESIKVSIIQSQSQADVKHSNDFRSVLHGTLTMLPQLTSIVILDMRVGGRHQNIQTGLRQLNHRPIHGHPQQFSYTNQFKTTQFNTFSFTAS